MRSHDFLGFADRCIELLLVARWSSGYAKRPSEALFQTMCQSIAQTPRLRALYKGRAYVEPNSSTIRLEEHNEIQGDKKAQDEKYRGCCRSLDFILHGALERQKQQQVTCGSASVSCWFFRRALLCQRWQNRHYSIFVNLTATDCHFFSFLQ